MFFFSKQRVVALWEMNLKNFRKFGTSQVREAGLVIGIPVKRHRGREPGPSTDLAGTHTGHTGAHEHTEDTDEPHNHPCPPTHPHDRATTDSAAGSTALSPQPQPRSRTLPAADSEEAASPQRTRPGRLPLPQSAYRPMSPRLLEGGRRNESTDTVTARAGLVPVPCERSFHIAKSVAFPVATLDFSFDLSHLPVLGWNRL